MPRKICDVHCHFMLPEEVDEIRSNFLLRDTFSLADCWNPERYLDFMEAADIEWSLLSLSSPHPYDRNDKRCAANLRVINENLAKIKRKYPDRFGFAASLPHPTSELAVEEAVYALDVLGADAVKLASSSRGLYLGDPQMEPLFAELDRRRAILLLHPNRPDQINKDVFSANILPLFEYICDTTRAVLHLVVNGVLERHQNLKVVVPHNGSFLPSIYTRFQFIANMLGKHEIIEPVDLKRIFARIYFDISGSPNPNTEYLLACMGPDKIMYGSDFPYMTKDAALELLRDTKRYFVQNERLSPYEDNIFSKTCRNLFKLNKE